MCLRCAALITTFVATPVFAQPAERVAAMRKLDLLVGSWKGAGWSLSPTGTREEFELTETVQRRAGGTVLLVEGHGATKAVSGKPPAPTHDGIVVVSYDEKPGIQAIATTAPDLPPKPGLYPSLARDHEYKRHGTLSLLAGIDLLTGQVHALVKDRHRSREFVEFLKLLDAAYPTDTAIKLILDNHSAHISKETKAWLAEQPEGRFAFTFTPKHGSWLNLIEGFFSKLARSVLRHIRVASKQELKERLMAAIDDINRHPVVHTWSYKLDQAA